LTYTWKRGETTVGTAASYTPTSADVGASLTVTVTGTKSGYVTATRSSEPTAAVALGTLTTVTSTITGTAKVGKTLTAVHGTWGPGTVSFAYQWYDGTTAISGATAATYSVPASRSGHSLHVAITGSKAGYTSVRSSSGSVKIAAGTLTGATPTISGTAKVGSTLTAVPGTWTSGVTRTYKWSRYTGGAWTTISGATKSTYKATTTDLGKKLRVTVTGTKTGYSTLVKSSAATAAVKAG
jgi:hypothetical protein